MQPAATSPAPSRAPSGPGPRSASAGEMVDDALENDSTRVPGDAEKRPRGNPATRVRLVPKSGTTSKHAKVKQWLAARPRFHLHFTPTYASWLNQVERWFGLLSQRAIKRGSFRSVADLVRKIQAFIDSYNASGTPFVWVATAQSIIDKVARISMRISGTAH